MYCKIMVAIDNSPWSDYAADLAVNLAARFGATLIGNHVYAARLHDQRFRQMEPDLPERYQTEQELNRLRGVHDDLITRGLTLISDSYLDVLAKKCQMARVPLERHTPEGKHFTEIIRDARESKADLVIMGAWGLSRLSANPQDNDAVSALMGSVCLRVARRVGCDLLVVKKPTSLNKGKITVGVDGSPVADAAVRRAVDLAQAFDMNIDAVAVFDPFFHKVAFESLAGVLSTEAASVFRFKEQERLHDELIDAGLARIYQHHLERAAAFAQTRGMNMTTHLLSGKPYASLARHVAKEQPDLLVIGRVGIHQSPSDDLGSNAEKLLHLAGTNVLLVAKPTEGEENLPEPASPAAETPLPWDPEAEARLQNVPPFARGMARQGIERYAREHGYSRITLEVYHQARKHFGMGT